MAENLYCMTIIFRSSHDSGRALWFSHCCAQKCNFAFFLLLCEEKKCYTSGTLPPSLDLSFLRHHSPRPRDRLANQWSLGKNVYPLPDWRVVAR